MDFIVDIKSQADIAIMYLKGHLDAHSVELFENQIVKLIKDNSVKIIVNCANLDYISSAGMGIIMGYLDEVQEKGGDIKLCSVNEKVFEIFELVGFTEIYDFLDNEKEAINKFDNE